MNTRSHILATARDLFSRVGYEAVGIQEICRASGITKPSLYYHFGSKAALLEQVVVDASTTFLHHLEDALCFSGDVVVDTRSLFSRTTDFAVSQPAQFQLLLQVMHAPEDSAMSRAGRREVKRIHHALTEYFQAAAVAHGNLSGKESFLALVFLGQAAALTSFSRNRPLERDSPEIVLAAQTFLYGIF